MKYEHIQKGIFLSRPNRFIAHVLISLENGQEESVVCHVKNTGRCKELLMPGVTVAVEFHPDAALLGRKTQYSLIGVWKERKSGPLLINMDSQAPNQAAYDWLLSKETGISLPYNKDSNKGTNSLLKIENLKREVTFLQSRFDLAFQSLEPRFSAFMEVKGVTLEEDDLAMFPDAPTLRGVKHVEELVKARKEGYEAYILFVIQMKGMKGFAPNKKTHPEFAQALKAAKDEGVHILAYDCIVTENSMTIDQPVPVLLDE
ncbi:DNA/RNA nuclease SfsA [Lacrimispora sp.]|uniref:DNA/RNA nuclease SfsA n=1 Tax=Lacrimispora sp. TaxID=2719234 RepID=UPI0028A8A68E|nr:DNA/RNA nuclease SfsA [Lacrimispora sp.]